METLCERMPDYAGPAEPPARLHGDLWGGNSLAADSGEPVLIDPAVYGGHREIDLAMMQLFGGFSSRVFDAYDETYPRAPGHEDRLALYQLYPLLAHVNLFGAGYLSQTDRALSRYVR
jgi:fructosamine-3-kinase